MVEEGYSRIKLLIDRREFEQALTEIEELHIQKRTIKSAVDRGSICYLRATALQGLGRYKEALCESQKAFEILRNTNENTLIAQIHFLRGIVYSDLGDLARSEDDFRDAVADYKRDSYSKGTTDAYNELARIRFIKGDYERAIEYLTKCISYYEQIGDTRGKAKASANLGRVHIRTGNWKLAEAYLKVSTKAHRESGNRLGFCNGLLSSGYVSYLQRDFVRARECYKRALRFIHENDYFRELGIYHEYAGELEFAESDLDTARHHFLKAIAIGEKIGDGSALVSQTYRLLAELQISDHEHNEALASSEQALEAARSLKERIEIGAIHRALGQIYTAKKQKQKAAESFGKSLRVLEQIGAKFELGKSYLEAGKSDCFDLHDRTHYLRRAKEVFKDLDSKYHEGLVYFSISKLLSDNGDSEKALVFLDDAERIFKEANEENELASVSSLRKSLNKVFGELERSPDSKSKCTFSSIITQNHEMQVIIEQINKVKDLDLTILLEGETGTGKDKLAKAIHYQSRRKDKDFVAVQCSAIPEDLLENALFGHRKGSYTGANENSPGFFEQADGGTLYLDEIADIALSTQVKLLRFIEEKEITRLGETKPRKIDVRIIASTCCDLAERVSQGLFRNDLFYRLNVLPFRLPPLRERKEDIPLLVKHFLNGNGSGGELSRTLGSAEFMEKLLSWDWPGNVRDLKNEIERLTVLADVSNGANPSWLQGSATSGPFDAGAQPTTEPPLEEQVAELVRKKIVKALKQERGNKSRAAKVLGIPETTLRNKMKKYGIEWHS